MIDEEARHVEVIQTLLELKEAILMSANTDALAALTTAVEANTTAVAAAVTALEAGATAAADDISAGVNAQAAQVQANTDALTTASNPPAAPAAVVSDPAVS